MSTTEQNRPGYQAPRLPMPPKHWYIAPYSNRHDDDPELPYKPHREENDVTFGNTPGWLHCVIV